MSWNPHGYDFRLSLLFNRLQTPTMEVTTQSMHGPLRGELGKFGKFQRTGLFEILSQIGKGGGY